MKPLDYFEIEEKDGEKILCWLKHDINVPANIVIPAGITTIGEEAFAGSNIKSVVIPDSVTYIGDAAFECCKELESVVFPKGRLYIQDNTFQNCSSLTSVNIPEGCYHIGVCAFADCTSLKTVKLPSSLYKDDDPDFSGFTGCVGEGIFAFERCTELMELDLPVFEFMCLTDLRQFKKLKKVRILEGGKSFGEYFSFDCESLEEVELPSSLETIKEDVFDDCPNLSTITVSEENPAYKSVDGVVFSKDGKELVLYPFGRPGDSYIIPEGVEKVDGPFCPGNHIKSITLPKSLTAEFDLGDLDELESVNVNPENPAYTTIEGIVFSKDGKNMIYPPRKLRDYDLKITEVPEGVNIWIPRRMYSFLEPLNGYQRLQNIEVDKDNLLFKSVDGVLFSKDGESLICYPNGRDAECYEIPEGVKCIEPNAFYHSMVKEVKFPESLEVIGISAFHGCVNLKSVVIPANVKTIGNAAFYREGEKVNVDLKAMSLSPEKEENMIHLITDKLCIPEQKKTRRTIRRK